MRVTAGHCDLYLTLASGDTSLQLLLRQLVTMVVTLTTKAQVG